VRARVEWSGRNTFKLEEQLYSSEGVVFERVPFNDNQTTLDLIEAKRPMGILAYLDEEIIKPKTTDQTFLTVVNTQLKPNSQFVVLSTERSVFGIHHYAGDVKYNVDHFLEKNRDQLSSDLYDCVARSRSKFIARLFPLMDAASVQEARKSSLGKKFKQQLSDLMGRLYQTNPRYVRCIKSNHVKQPRVFEGQSCLLQLRYAGVFEAVRIRQSGFPFRYPHGVFYERYRLIADQKRVLPYPNPPNAKQLVTDLLAKIAALPNSRVAVGSDLQVGLTRVLYRTGPHRVLELLRNVQLEKRVVVIQAYARGWFARKGARKLRALRVELEAATRSRDVAQLRAVIAKAEGILIEDKYIWAARHTLHVIEAEMRLRAQIPALLKRDKEVPACTCVRALAHSHTRTHPHPQSHRATRHTGPAPGTRPRMLYAAHASCTRDWHGMRRRTNGAGGARGHRAVARGRTRDRPRRRAGAAAGGAVRERQEAARRAARSDAQRRRGSPHGRCASALVHHARCMLHGDCCTAHGA
jgi:hypothetical protein